MGTHCKVVIDASGMLTVGQGPGRFCKYAVFPCSPLLYTEQDVSHSLLQDISCYMGSTDPRSGIQESQFSVFKTRMLVSLNSSNLCFLMGRVTLDTTGQHCCSLLWQPCPCHDPKETPRMPFSPRVTIVSFWVIGLGVFLLIYVFFIVFIFPPCVGWLFLMNIRIRDLITNLSKYRITKSRWGKPRGSFQVVLDGVKRLTPNVGCSILWAGDLD